MLNGFLKQLFQFEIVTNNSYTTGLKDEFHAEDKFCFEVTKMLKTKFYYLYIFNILCYVKFNFDISAQLV